MKRVVLICEMGKKKTFECSNILCSIASTGTNPLRDHYNIENVSSAVAAMWTLYSLRIITINSWPHFVNSDKYLDSCTKKEEEITENKKVYQSGVWDFPQPFQNKFYHF